MDEPQQSQSVQQQQRDGRAEEDATEEQPAGVAEDTTPATAAAGQSDPR